MDWAKIKEGFSKNGELTEGVYVLGFWTATLDPDEEDEFLWIETLSVVIATNEARTNWCIRHRTRYVKDPSPKSYEGDRKTFLIANAVDKSEAEMIETMNDVVSRLHPITWDFIPAKTTSGMEAIQILQQWPGPDGKLSQAVAITRLTKEEYECRCRKEEKEQSTTEASTESSSKTP